MNQLTYTLTSNAVVQAKRVTKDGREWLVAPAVSIVPGVLPGSQGPLLYRHEDCARNVAEWDKVPLVAYHPMDDLGNPCAATHPGVLSRQGIGHIRNSVFDGRLRHVFWIDVNRARSVDPFTNGAGTKIINALERGRPLSISTGLFTTNIPRTGTTANGRGYTAIATSFVPDHVAVLVDQRGACDIGDGCGLLLNQQTYTINPFKSQAQRRWMYANDPEMAERWEKHTPKGKKLPERKKQTHNVAGPKDGCGDGG